VNDKMNDRVGNIPQNKLYACCYILLSGTRRVARGGTMGAISPHSGSSTSNFQVDQAFDV